MHILRIADVVRIDCPEEVSAIGWLLKEGVLETVSDNQPIHESIREIEQERMRKRARLLGDSEIANLLSWDRC
jgi:hypothetical protein